MFDVTEFGRDGYAVVGGVVGAGEVGRLIGAAEEMVAGEGVSGHGARDLFRQMPRVVELARSRGVRGLVESVLGANAVAVRGIYFDKTAGANWKVAWHQDLSIAVRERPAGEVAGYGPWSVKGGITHVQPPAGVLEGMVTVRVHLDDCDGSNGPLRVIRGSHSEGVLSAEGMARWRGRGEEVECVCRAGDAVVMRPLILHASSAAEKPGHRRVIHLEFAARDLLAEGLEWWECIS